ncbi:MAG: 16S rRNA (uracil(1498)-N(3))-methyltransferase [Bacteroidota bacterium]
MQLFYNTEINLEEHLLLPEDEARHIVKALRYKTGDAIFFTDGKGFIYEGIVANDNYSNCEIKWSAKKEGSDKRTFRLHMAVAPTKNLDRFEWFVEKATELGIDEITPLLCSNSEKFSIKIDRLQKLAVSAMKQSNRTVLPIINPLVKFNDFFANASNDKMYIAHCYNSEKKQLKTALQLNKNTTILIGPEGDFSEKEVELALQHKAQAISLGNARLRTETAAMKACCLVNILHE